MASVHRMRRSPFWYCAFMLPDGRRTLRSTGTSDRRDALRVGLEWEDAAKLGREGRLTEERTRATMAVIFERANRETMPSSTVGDFLDSWLKKKSLELADTSFPEYERTARDFQAYLETRSKRPVDAITAKDAGAYRARLAKRLGGGSVNKAIKMLRAAWSDALKQGLARENIFQRIDLVKVRKSNSRPFTLPELKKLLDACRGSEWEGLVLVGLYTGQRLTDCASLTWRQIDLAREEVVLTTQKTGRHMTIPMAEPLKRYFMALPSSDDPGARVFPRAWRLRTASGGSGTLSRQFGELLADAGILAKRETKKHVSKGKGRSASRDRAELSFHALRHTATSLLKNAGVSDVVAREIIGHDSEAVSRVYTHIEDGTMRAAIAKMPDVTAVT